MNLLAKIEAEINKVVEEQQKNPTDIHIATKKNKLKKLAMDYVQLENQFKQLTALTSA